ncbi:PAN domain-containing protein [Mesorhizobium sp. M0768]|uniref:PAN domain-containing protein n=1 Tax=unclassified Mesorhizobium TaxID=325217 RepID=UPI0033392200
MLVRHNTSLLEQAVDLVIQRSAIPTLQAQAAAQEKTARATAFRRMATGGAIAVAAVGVGLGIKLGLWDKSLPEPMVLSTIEQSSARTVPNVDHPPIPIPTPKPAPEETPRVDVPAKPDVVTVDFNKFATKSVEFQGIKWELISGHHFKDEKDETWDRAWCYSRRSVNGVDVNVALASRSAPNAPPVGPGAAVQTLQLVGLNDSSAVDLVTKCAWLDGRTFASSDVIPDQSREQANAVPTQTAVPEVDPDSGFVVVSGWDAIGNDLPDMPIRSVSSEQCQSACDRDFKCLAVTYNTKFQACFMKGDASLLVKSAESIMAAKKVVEGNLRYSNLVFATKTEISGNAYWNSPLRYPDCILQCANDNSCLGFNFRKKESACVLFNRITQSADNAAVVSGIKSVAN